MLGSHSYRDTRFSQKAYSCGKGSLLNYKSTILDLALRNETFAKYTQEGTHDSDWITSILNCFLKHTKQLLD